MFDCVSYLFNGVAELIYRSESTVVNVDLMGNLWDIAKRALFG